MKLILAWYVGATARRFVWEQRVHQLAFKEQSCALPVAKANRFICCLTVSEDSPDTAAV